MTGKIDWLQSVLRGDVAFIIAAPWDFPAWKAEWKPGLDGQIIDSPRRSTNHRFVCHRPHRRCRHARSGGLLTVKNRRGALGSRDTATAMMQIPGRFARRGREVRAQIGDAQTDAGGLAVTVAQPGGVAVQRTYDALWRMTTESGSGGGSVAASRTLGYDLASRLTSVNFPGGTQNFGYDDRGLILSSTGPAGTTSWAYNPVGLVASRVDVAGTSTYTYTNRNETAQIGDPISGPKSFVYTPERDLASATHGQTVRTFTYDGIGRVASDSLKNAQTNAALTSNTYTYDAAGNVTSQNLQAPSNPAAGLSTYAYDLADRLISWTAPSGPVTNYAYDAAGNRTQAGASTFTYDERNRLTSGPDGANMWSPRGTLNSTTKNGVTTSYGFDGLGRMTAAGPVSYTYDGLDRMAQRVESGVTTSFGYDGRMMQPSTDGATVISRGPDGLILGVAKAGLNYGAGLNNHKDLTHLYNPATGQLTDSGVFDPWGLRIGATGTSGINFGFQGNYTDPVTNQIWMGTRWYSAANAQFLSRDVIDPPRSGPVAGNLYAYGNVNPVTLWDPTGKEVVLPGLTYEELCPQGAATSQYCADLTNGTLAETTTTELLTFDCSHMNATEIADLRNRGGGCIPGTELPNGTLPTTTTPIGVDCTGMDQTAIDHVHAGGGVCDPGTENPGTQPTHPGPHHPTNHPTPRHHKPTPNHRTPNHHAHRHQHTHRHHRRTTHHTHHIAEIPRLL